MVYVPAALAHLTIAQSQKHVRHVRLPLLDVLVVLQLEQQQHA